MSYKQTKVRGHERRTQSGNTQVRDHLRKLPIKRKLTENQIEKIEQMIEEFTTGIKIDVYGEWFQAGGIQYPRISEESLGEWLIESTDDDSPINGFALFLNETGGRYYISVANGMMGEFDVGDRHTKRDAIEFIKIFTSTYDTWEKFKIYMKNKHNIDGTDYIIP